MRSGLFFASTLLATSLLASCSNSPSTKEVNQSVQGADNEGQGAVNNAITLDYPTEIEGYRVRVYWKPVKIKYAYVIGPAILEFSNAKDSTSFTLTSNHFSVPKSTLKFKYNEDSTQIKGFNERRLQMAYKGVPLDSKAGGFGSANEPFFFADVDFDQIKELLITEADQGQRGTAIFKVYQFDDSYNAPEPSEMSAEPFASLDALSTIDYGNKSITIENSNGAYTSSQDTYNLKAANYEGGAPYLALASVVEGQVDEATNKPYEARYKVLNDKRILISRKEVKVEPDTED